MVCMFLVLLDKTCLKGLKGALQYRCRPAGSAAELTAAPDSSSTVFICVCLSSNPPKC